MKTRSTTVLLAVALTAATFGCERSGEPPPQSEEPPATQGLTPNGDPDAGDTSLADDAGEPDSDAGTEDAGNLDAGEEDAGPECPVFMQLIDGFCQPEVSVRLTGTAAAIRGDTLYAGTGQQPVLEVFLGGPAKISPAEVTIALGPSQVEGAADAGALESHAISSATSDDAGTHYDFPWSTAALPEGSYQARASVLLGDAGFQSNVVNLLVDRTPPAIEVNLAFPQKAQEQPRDFHAIATVTAADDGGSGEVHIALTGTGVVVVPSLKGLTFRTATKVDLSTELPAVQGTTTILTTPVRGHDIPYDAWSTKQDAWPIEIDATATDLVGNVASAKVSVPVTRALWNNVLIDTSGPLSIGAQGQILVNHGLRLDSLLPDGTPQSSTPIEGGVGAAATLATGAPKTLVSRKTPQGQTFVLSQVKQPPFLSYGQLSSVGPYDSFAPLEGPPTMSLALSASRELLYLLPQNCALLPIDPLTGTSEAPSGPYDPFPNSCGGVGLAIGKDHLVATGPGIDLSYALNPVDGAWSGQPNEPAGAAPVFLGNLAVFNVGDDLALFDPATGPGSNQIELEGAIPAKVVTSSEGDLFVLQSDGTLTKLSSEGVTAWQHTLKGGLGSSGLGLAIGVDAEMIYAVDGAGAFSAFDGSGTLRWKSPEDWLNGDPLIDRCTGHAYVLGLNQIPLAMVTDSLGLDMGAGAWPVGGHDVFQTYDSQGTADVDCADHL